MIDHLEKFKRAVNLRMSGIAMFAIVGVASMAAVDYYQLGLFWINLYWLICAAFAFHISLLAFPSRRGLRRTVRTALALSLGSYLVGQMVWGLQVLVGWNIVPGPSDIIFLFVPLPAIWAALVATRRRVSPASGTTAALDAVSMSLAIVTIILAMFGQKAVGFGLLEATNLLLYPILYLSPVGAFLVASLAVREEPRFAGNWLIMLGALTSGISFSIWTSEALAGSQPVGAVVDYCFGIGLILMGLGAATIDTVSASTKAKRQVLIFLSELLPLIAIVTAVLAALISDIPAALKPLIWIVIAALLIINGNRQILLIRSQRRAQQSLRTLSAELTNTEESERRKIATYLHDKVGQSIAVMSLKFGEIRGATENTIRIGLLDDVDSLLSDAANDIRTSTFDISPPILYELGLVPAIGSLAAALSNEFSADIRFIDNGIFRPISDSVKPLLYRFVRELLMNVIKHADAESVSVTLSQDHFNTHIVVQDDGVGFDMTTVTVSDMGGFGLYSIRERARAIGGTFEIQSSIGEGTKASVILPIEI